MVVDISQDPLVVRIGELKRELDGHVDDLREERCTRWTFSVRTVDCLVKAAQDVMNLKYNRQI